MIGLFVLMSMLTSMQPEPFEPCDGQGDLSAHMWRDSIGAPRRLPAR